MTSEVEHGKSHNEKALEEKKESNTHKRRIRVSKELVQAYSFTKQVLCEFAQAQVSFLSTIDSSSSLISESFPVISVGSGTGYLEYYIESFLKSKKVICVDPNPTKFRPNDSLVKVPDFATVQDMLQQQETQKVCLKNYCHLLLLWPSPSGSCYDLEAISLLEPVSFLVLFDITGAAGGVAFHQWLSTQDGATPLSKWTKFLSSNTKEQLDNLTPQVKYKKVLEKTKEPHIPPSFGIFSDIFGPCQASLQLFVRTDIFSSSSFCSFASSSSSSCCSSSCSSSSTSKE